MAALEEIFAEIERIQKENARIFYCHPDDIDRVRAAADRILWWPSYWEIKESPFVPVGQIICLDPGAVEKAIRERPVMEYRDEDRISFPPPESFIKLNGGA